MKNIIFLTSILIANLVFGQNSKPDSLLEAYLMKSKSIGMVAGFSKGDEMVVLSSGYANLEDNQPISTDAKVRVASVTKIFTAVAIMQLVEGNKVGLDDQVSTYINDLPSALSKITVRQLLDHSSGIRAYNSLKERENKKEYRTLNDAFSIFKNDPLEMNPGSAFRYTTYGYVLLGMLIEKASEMSYADYLKTNIFLPAGMKNTDIERMGSVLDDQSEVYHRSSKGKVKKAIRTNLSDRIPGGGLYSTVNDMLLFGTSLMNDKLISKSSFEQMTTDSGLKKKGNPYGLGLYLYGENPRYGNVVGHSGTQTGASVQLMLLPDINAVTFVASNTSGVWEDAFMLSVLYFQLANEL